MVEEIIHNSRLMAIIITNNYKEEGVHFFTPDDFSQQLAYMHHAKGKIIEPHLHNKVKRVVHFTNEVLIIRKGLLRVDFYNEEKIYLKSRLLRSGDVILLSEGGHGFEALEELEMIEVKQGPYTGEKDKTHIGRHKGDYIFD